MPRDSCDQKALCHNVDVANTSGNNMKHKELQEKKD